MPGGEAPLPPGEGLSRCQRRRGTPGTGSGPPPQNAHYAPAAYPQPIVPRPDLPAVGRIRPRFPRDRPIRLRRTRPQAPQTFVRFKPVTNPTTVGHNRNRSSRAELGRRPLTATMVPTPRDRPATMPAPAGWAPAATATMVPTTGSAAELCGPATTAAPPRRWYYNPPPAAPYATPGCRRRPRAMLPRRLTERRRITVPPASVCLPTLPRISRRKCCGRSQRWPGPVHARGSGGKPARGRDGRRPATCSAIPSPR